MTVVFSSLRETRCQNRHLSWFISTRFLLILLYVQAATEAGPQCVKRWRKRNAGTRGASRVQRLWNNETRSKESRRGWKVGACAIRKPLMSCESGLAAEPELLVKSTLVLRFQPTGDAHAEVYKQCGHAFELQHGYKYSKRVILRVPL